MSTYFSTGVCKKVSLFLNDAQVRKLAYKTQRNWREYQRRQREALRKKKAEELRSQIVHLVPQDDTTPQTHDVDASVAPALVAQPDPQADMVYKLDALCVQRQRMVRVTLRKPTKRDLLSDPGTPLRAAYFKEKGKTISGRVSDNAGTFEFIPNK